MKILAIRLENLASLAGRHEIDFTTAPLADQGLFAITGPTGAGKSTLLDALCLALYGSTPRLRQAPTRDSQIEDVNHDTLTTADPRTLLRRGCASGFAEVDFVGRDGCRYRARWAVRRARDKVDGSLQKTEQSLSELDDGRLLTAQKREFDKLLPARLGLTFDQFTRAVLLAQSEFAAFLKADDNERSELLERLTDTQHYSAISKAAYQRVREARAALDAIDARLADALPVDAETRAVLEQEAEAQERALARLQVEIAAHQAERIELERDARLAQAWQAAADELERADAAWQAQGAERERLRQLDELAPWRDRARRRQALENTLATRRQTLQETHRQQQACDTERESLEPQLAAARQQRDQARQAHREAQPQLEQARRLAAEHERQRQQLAQQENERRQLRDATDSDERRRQQLLANRQPLERRLVEQRDALERLLAQAGPGETAFDLRTQLNRRRDQAQASLQRLQQLERDWQERERLRQEHDDARHQIQTERRRLDALETEGKGAAERLAAAEAEESHVREQIERARAARSDSVEQLRQQLRQDQPCPVCGGLDHPYRHAPPPHPGEAMIAAIEQQERSRLATLHERVEQARQAYHQCAADWRAGRDAVQERQRQLESLSQRLSQAEATLDTHAEAAALRAAEDPKIWLERQQAAANETWRQASERLAALDTAERELQPLEAEWQQLALELGKLEERIALGHARLQAIEASLPALRQACDATARALNERLGNEASVNYEASINDWHNALEQCRQRAEQALERHQARWQSLEQTRVRLSQRLADLAQRQQEEEHEFAELDHAWQAWRQERLGLDDARLAALLEVSEADHHALRATQERLERERDAARITHGERQQALLAQRRALLSSQHEPNQDEATLLDETCTQRLANRLAAQREQAETLERRHRECQESRDGAQHRLREDDRRRQAQQEGARERARAEAEVHRWERLNGLIGSADGKRFRRIAQAYNLDYLLTHANQHLDSLTPRYRLARGGSELGILVIDGDMADERRSVHSLSGGETFLVSLALALGLASMASHQLAIESLFIDEGFGSLDPESLALAMDALDGLQAQGRRVGVISHVQEMHERIPLQIRVEPRGNGASGIRIQRS